MVTFKATDDDTKEGNKDFSFYIISVTPKPQDLEFFLKQARVGLKSAIGTLSFKGCLNHEVRTQLA